MTPKPSPDPRLVVKSTSRREIVIATLAAVLVLGGVVWGILAMQAHQARPSKNQLTGVILAKHDSGEREQLVAIGRKGLKKKDGDSGYWVDVKVEPGGRVYEVPVTKAQWETKKVGDTQTFIRPPSEQR